MLIRRRKKHQSQLPRKRLLRLSLIVLILILLYLLFDGRYLLVLQSIQIPRLTFEHFHKHSGIISDRYRMFYNRTNIDLKDPPTLFQPSIPSHYPQLPIHIFTQNFTSLKNQTKLILLGNSLFSDDKWGLPGIDNSSKALMTQLSCPFLSNYCDISADQTLAPHADAVVFHIRDEIDRDQAEKYRHPDQRFVFALWESPRYTPNLKSFERFFNWTMTYRFHSHIIASYYFTNAYIHKSSDFYRVMMETRARENLQFMMKTIDHQISDQIFAEKKLGTAAALISNCGGDSRRLRLILRLRPYVDVKVYGKCGKTCPANVDCREFIARNYYFFFSFENSLCRDYATEKFFTTLQYPIVPVVYGRSNYSYFIPPSAFIDVNNFDSSASLGQYLLQIRNNKEKYSSYFTWKKDYVWGITQMLTPLCDLCLRLHLDSTPNIIEDIDAWWHGGTCETARIFFF